MDHDLAKRLDAFRAEQTDTVAPAPQQNAP